MGLYHPHVTPNYRAGQAALQTARLDAPEGRRGEGQERFEGHLAIKAGFFQGRDGAIQQGHQQAGAEHRTRVVRRAARLGDLQLD